MEDRTHCLNACIPCECSAFENMKVRSEKLIAKKKILDRMHAKIYRKLNIALDPMCFTTGRCLRTYLPDALAVLIEQFTYSREHFRCCLPYVHLCANRQGDYDWLLYICLCVSEPDGSPDELKDMVQKNLQWLTSESIPWWVYQFWRHMNICRIDCFDAEHDFDREDLMKFYCWNKPIQCSA